MSVINKDDIIHLKCTCGSSRHAVEVAIWRKDPTLSGDVDFFYINTAMCHYLPWYKRLWVATLYVLGIDNTYTDYKETVITKENTIKLRDWLNRKLED